MDQSSEVTLIKRRAELIGLIKLLRGFGFATQ